MRHDLPWDIAVEVVMRVGNNPERFPTKACVFAYALEAMPKAAGRYRKRSRREVVFLHAPARICEQPSFAQRDRIRRALDRLPQVLRETYVAVEILGETPEAFAEREGITARTVENRLSLARGRLRAVLAEEDS
jgi:DNA-directed RNA polymerase specialized sigma24 family protein